MSGYLRLGLHSLLLGARLPTRQGILPLAGWVYAALDEDTCDFASLLSSQQETIIDIIKQILESFSGTLPTDSKTAAAIARNAPPEEISSAAQKEGLTSLATMLFEVEQEQDNM